ncbi:hypothetical protein Tco_1488898, partial [Tanacetum coccineum]
NHALDQLVLVVSLRFHLRGHGFESAEGIIPSCHVSIHVADTWAHMADTWIHVVQVAVTRYCLSEVVSTRLSVRGWEYEVRDSRVLEADVARCHWWIQLAVTRFAARC